MRPTAFDMFHPLVPAAYFLLVLGCTMALFHPALLVISFALGTAYNAYLRGCKAMATSLAWQIPLLAIIALLNPLFVGSGSTELFRIGSRAFYLEALIYGAGMGCMLVSTLLWISCAAQVITSDKLMHLTGKALPTMGLMLSLTGRLVPQLLRQGREIGAIQAACTSARKQTAPTVKRRSALSAKLRQTTVLMGWSMEDSLETSDAMLARGWGAVGKRTSYARTRMRTIDFAAIILLVALAAADVTCVILFGKNFTFYPAVSGLLPWQACIPHAILLALPLLTEAVWSILWNR